jgi:hypothetical protein
MELMVPMQRRWLSLFLLVVVPVASMAPCLCATSEAGAMAEHGCCEKGHGWVSAAASGCCDAPSEESAPATVTTATVDAGAPPLGPASLLATFATQGARPLAGYAAADAHAPTPLRI